MTKQYHKNKAKPVDVWKITEAKASPDNPQLQETLFALANGYFGTRGTLEESDGGRYPCCEGTYLNGVYQREEIPYGEIAPGFARLNDKMVQLPNGKYIRLFLGKEEFQVSGGTIDNHLRYLDMRLGIVYRRTEWTSPSGRKIRVESQRFVSLANQNLMVQKYSVTPLNFSGIIEIHSGLDNSYSHGVPGQNTVDDPRTASPSTPHGLRLIDSGLKGGEGYFLHNIRGAEGEICSAFRDIFISSGVESAREIITPDLIGTVYKCVAEKNNIITLVKYVGYLDNATVDKIDLKQRVCHILAAAAKSGFGALLDQHQRALDNFWHDSDITIVGDPLLQQGMHFNLFHIFQSVGRDGYRNIGAKGLSGSGYDGHYFWDTEIYIIPFLVFTSPEIARKLLEYRYRILPHARRRARELSHEVGALYAWRTIGGDECSAYFPASTAQYHINAAIAYAINQYFEVTGDWPFMVKYGAEMLFETARIWPGIGRFSARHGGQFCIYEVTGPDEYTALVDNNFYTNVMARMHLQAAVDIARRLAQGAPKVFQALCEKISLTEEEILLWAKIADKIYLPYDEKLKINPQNDGFLDKPRWDFDHTPKDSYPLLLHYHPLVIYRHQVLKQADVILAMFLRGDYFSLDLKRRNLDYYEPLTTHDSTLSACIHGIECAETGQYQRAYDFFKKTVRMDLDNHHNNTEYGLHTACMAGSWMSVVNGFAGMRIREGMLTFHPFLPDNWPEYAFALRFREYKLRLAVRKDLVSYELVEGAKLEIRHDDQRIILLLNQPQTVEMELSK